MTKCTKTCKISLGDKNASDAHGIIEMHLMESYGLPEVVHGGEIYMNDRTLGAPCMTSLSDGLRVSVK